MTTRTSARDSSAGDLTQEGEPVDVGHPDVAEHHLRPRRADQAEPRAAVRGFSDQLELRLGPDQGPQSHPDQLLVVDDGDVIGTSLTAAAPRAVRTRPSDATPP